MVVCPICGERSIGRVGVGHYYCKECCHEFVSKKNKFNAYNVEDDGTLSQYIFNEAIGFASFPAKQS